MTTNEITARRAKLLAKLAKVDTLAWEGATEGERAAAAARAKEIHAELRRLRAA